MDVWRLCHGQDGYRFELSNIPVWALALSRGVEAVDVAADHFFCRPPNWIWFIPLGRPVYEEDFLANSLAGSLYRLFSWAFSAELRHERVLHSIAVPDELARALGAQDEAFVDADS